MFLHPCKCGRYIEVATPDEPIPWQVTFTIGFAIGALTWEGLATLVAHLQWV